MLSLYRTLSLRYLGQRWLRAVLIVACIALGVGTLVATRALNETMATAARAATNPMGGLADLVVNNGELPISESIADELAAIPEVEVARPCIFKNIQLADGDERIILLMGFDLQKFFDESKGKGVESLGKVTVSDETVRNFAVMTGGYEWTRGLIPPPAIVGNELDLVIAKDKYILVKKNHQAEADKLQRAGSIRAEGNAAVLEGNIVLLNLNAARKLLGLEIGQVNRIDLVLKRDSNIKEVRDKVVAVLDGRAGVRTPQEQSRSIENVLSGMQTAFSLCGIAALVVG